MKQFRGWDIEAALIKSNMPKVGSLSQSNIMLKETKQFHGWDIEAALIKSNMPKVELLSESKLRTKSYFLGKTNRGLLLNRFPFLSNGVKFPKIS